MQCCLFPFAPYPQEPIIFLQLHNISAVVRPHAYNIFPLDIRMEKAPAGARARADLDEANRGKKYVRENETRVERRKSFALVGAR